VSEVLASFLLYSGLVCLLWWPQVGVGCLAIALAIPPRRRRLEAAARTEQDRRMPEWHFDEVHQTQVNAPAEKAFRAVLDTTAGEILFYETLTAIRRAFGGGGDGQNILRAAKDRPLLESAEKGGFERLLEIPGQEVLVGAKLNEAIRVTMNFTFDAGAVRTETRVYASSARSRWLFAWYWRLIYPGSSMIRYMWLRAIRLRALAG
jgi:hypothetical protein